MHSWNLSPKAAIQIQQQLKQHIIQRPLPEIIKTVAGIDVSVKHNVSNAAIAVLEFPSLKLLATATHTQPATFPYIPGLLTFREGEAICRAFAKLTIQPDVLIFDGHGIAHPRRIGIASHLGLLLSRPAIGCGKTKLCGTYQEPGSSKGSCSDLIEKGELIGKVVRTRKHYKPVFISSGYQADLSQAVELILKCCPRYKLPETTRYAHQLSKQFTPDLQLPIR